MRLGGTGGWETQKSLCHLKQIKALALWSIYISDSLRDLEQLGPGPVLAIQESWLLLSLAPRHLLHIVCFGAVVSAFVDYFAFTVWQVPSLTSPAHFVTHFPAGLTASVNFYPFKC